MGRDGTTPSNCDIDLNPPQYNSPVIIQGISVYTAIGHSGIFQVINKLQSTSPDKIGYNQKMDTSVDRKFSGDQDSASIFSKIIVRELSHGSISDLYLCCWMDFASNVVQTKVPQFVELGLPSFNISDEFGIQGNPATRIRRLTDVYHWSALDHIFSKATSV